MRRIACPLFVFGAIFACGDRRKAASTDDRIAAALGADAGRIRRELRRNAFAARAIFTRSSTDATSLG